MIRPVPHVLDMSPYALADLSPPKGKKLISLSQNESFRAPSPHAIAAGSEALASAHLYPDPDWSALRAALAEIHEIPESGILCGNGSMELIECLMQAYASPDLAVLAPDHVYPFFRTAARMARARFDSAPETDCTVSIDALLQAVQPDTGIVCIANPANPTGTRIPRSELTRLREGLPGHVLLIIDEAYGEFADLLNETTFDMVERGNTVILRTFSKAYGLAGMRAGWGLFPTDVASQIRKVMNPNNLSVASQAAALAAVLDQTYMRETCALTSALRGSFSDRLRASGFDVLESFTNFVLIRFDTAGAAHSADLALQSEGMFLRPQGGVGLSHCLRATVGDHEGMDKAAKLLERWAGEGT
ncbi:MAG: aminotransferase class I/II-fold pyridoxal phosphate-dependent enzyme [Boseongicola sp.]|nr:aminotransferase class I/II-fold pyridoxal phosphate-dependent enzyme [Boseongicola sp.]